LTCRSRNSFVVTHNFNGSSVTFDVAGLSPNGNASLSNTGVTIDVRINVLSDTRASPQSPAMQSHGLGEKRLVPFLSVNFSSTLIPPG